MSTPRKPTHQMSAISLAVALTAATQAHAQLEEVVVTAQKRAESMQDVPIALAAFTSDSMQDMGITSSQDLQVAVPSLVFPSLGNLGQVYLRGVGTRFTLNGLDPSVATYVGERYSPRGSGAIFSLGPDVERVEILKGPQGVLFGRNATGGAIRIIKKDVTEELEGEIQASIGNYDYYKVGGTVNLPISDTFGVRLSGQIEERDGFRKNIAAGQMTYLGPIPDRHDELDRAQFNVHAKWTPSDRLQADLFVDYWQQDELQGSTYVLGPPELNRGILFGGLVYGLSHDTTSTDANQPNDGDQIGSELRLRYSFDEVDLVSVTTYADFEMQWNSEGDGSSAQIFDPASAFDTSKTFSQELRLESTGDGQLSWTVGGFYYEDEHDQEFIFWTDDFAVLYEASQGAQTVDTTSYAAFGSVRYELTDRLAVTAGVRYSYDERDVVMRETSRSDLANRTLAAPLLPFNYSGDWSETTPQLTVEYNFDETMFYATYSSGYKSGGVNYPIYSTPAGIDPEVLDMFEVGLKGDYLDNTLRVNASLFYYDYSDLQVQRPASSGAGTTVENAADAEVLGLDIDATWAPTADFTLRMGMSALDSEYSDYTAIVQFSRATLDGTIGTANPTPGAAGQQIDVSGRNLLKAPELSYFITVNYDFNLGNARMPVSLTYSYKDDTIFDFGDDPAFGPYLTQDGYGLLSGRISYEPAAGNWSVGLWGRNLTDEEYLSEIAANAQGLRGAPADPRTFGIDARYSF